MSGGNWGPSGKIREPSWDVRGVRGALGAERD